MSRSTALCVSPSQHVNSKLTRFESRATALSGVPFGETYARLEIGGRFTNPLISLTFVIEVETKPLRRYKEYLNSKFLEHKIKTQLQVFLTSQRKTSLFGKTGSEFVTHVCVGAGIGRLPDAKPRLSLQFKKPFVQLVLLTTLFKKENWIKTSST